MSKICENCGTQLDSDVDLCVSCEAQKRLSDPPTLEATPVSEAIKMVTNAVFASGAAGESQFSHAIPKAAGELSAAISPFKVISQSVSGLYRSFITVFKDKKRLISALVLALIWFVLTLLPLLGVNPIPVKWLSFLTFAQGGTSGGIIGFVGGTVGKGVFAYFLMTLVMPLTRGQKPFAGIGGGIKQFLTALKVKKMAQAAPLFLGAGAALISYNFMTGKVSLQNSMAGVAALLLSLRALSGKAGFLRRFFSAFIAKKTKEIKLNTGDINRVIAGVTAGFALALPLSALNIHRLQLPYVIGAVLLIAGLILGIVLKADKEVAL